MIAGEGMQRMPRWIARSARRLPWLAYLPLFVLPWWGEHPGVAALAGGTIGLLLFLFVYLGSSDFTGRRLLAAAVAVLLLGFALAATGGIWPVITIYAAAMAGELRPTRYAIAATIVFAALAAGFGLAIGAPLFTWAIGVFMMIAVGFGNVSRALLEDRNRALVAARDEIELLAIAAERERIGRDLHDLLGRTLTLVAIKAALAARLAPRDAGAAEREMLKVAEAARTALAEVRAAVSGYAGASLPREIEASRAALRAVGVEPAIDGDFGAVPAGPGAVLAMALREAVTNVVRHAGAGACRIARDKGWIASLGWQRRVAGSVRNSV